MQSGKVIRTPRGYKAFVPHPPPPPFGWSGELVGALSSADRALGRLAGEGAKLPNPHLLIRPFVTREAVLSSRIEGTRATIEEVLEGVQGGDVQEVQDYIRALDFGLERLGELPLSIRLLKEVHALLMESAHLTPGEFRTSQNWIGPPGSTLANASYIPPPPEELADCMGKLELFLHDRTLPPLIHIAICHYQFEAIHPFLDGNGRVGRLLITFLLMEWNLLPSPLLYLSAYFEEERSAYYHRLAEVTQSGDWHGWFLYFLRGVAKEAHDALSRASALKSLIDEWLGWVQKEASSLPTEVVRHLAANPFVTVRQIATQFQVAFTTASRTVDKLEALGILTQTKPVKHGRVYCARSLLEIVSAQ